MQDFTFYKNKLLKERVDITSCNLSDSEVNELIKIYNENLLIEKIVQINKDNEDPDYITYHTLRRSKCISKNGFKKEAIKFINEFDFMLNKEEIELLCTEAETQIEKIDYEPHIIEVILNVTKRIITFQSV